MVGPDAIMAHFLYLLQRRRTNTDRAICNRPIVISANHLYCNPRRMLNMLFDFQVAPRVRELPFDEGANDAIVTH